MSIGNRLKEERERLGWTQQAVAEIGGVSKRSQIDYEQNKIEMKSAYLSAIAIRGVDIHYVLTGIRSVQGSLSDKEQLLVSVFRNQDHFVQGSLSVLFERLAGTPTASAKSSRSGALKE